MDSQATLVYIEVLATDSVGRPVPFSHATITTNPAPAIGPLEEALADPNRGLRDGIIVPLGADGLALQELGVYPDGHVTDVTVTIQTPGCGDRNRMELPGRPVGTAYPQDTLRFSVRVPTPYPVAVLDSGQICAQGIDSVWGPQSFLFILNVDSTTGPLFSGRWSWAPLWTDIGDRGTFQGASGLGFAVLDFVSGRISERCTGLRLTVDVLPDGRWGEAQLSNVPGCLVNAGLFTFGSGEHWPGAFP